MLKLHVDGKVKLGFSQVIIINRGGTMRQFVRSNFLGLELCEMSTLVGIKPNASNEFLGAPALRKDKGLWSVCSTKVRKARNLENWRTAKMIAKHSRSVTE
ncbi:hypothetical protein PoB_004371600 [Plakobranchus ocellatus]|uniref:Uncharacterized protein n=1 Tax=Plakobranchus ocellatus TaxID=259542 RepID=A0AAV4B9V7_9GAST|nr:hypothetical protein PoB_004371600 [Plakobranchus ocellatus]